MPIGFLYTREKNTFQISAEENMQNPPSTELVEGKPISASAKAEMTRIMNRLSELQIPYVKLGNPNNFGFTIHIPVKVKEHKVHIWAGSKLIDNYLLPLIDEEIELADAKKYLADTRRFWLGESRVTSSIGIFSPTSTNPAATKPEEPADKTPAFSS